MTIGEKIRHYRLEKGMTQEKLAAELNLSFQAVSKWERNESLPDITIIGRLSQILSVSCDALLTEHPFFQETELQKIMAQAEALDDTVHAEYLTKTSLLEKALEKYPRSMELAAALADVYSKGADYPEYTSNNYLHRAAELHRYIMENTDDSRMKYRSVQMLCYLYRAEGKYGLVRKLAESMPEICQCRPALLYHSLPENQIKEGIRDYIGQLLDTAESMMNVLLYPDCADTKLMDALRARIRNCFQASLEPPKKCCAKNLYHTDPFILNSMETLTCSPAYNKP